MIPPVRLQLKLHDLGNHRQPRTRVVKFFSSSNNSLLKSPIARTRTFDPALRYLHRIFEIIRIEVDMAKTAKEIFVECMQKGGVPTGLTPKQKNRVNTIFEWFSSMATREELAALSPSATDLGGARCPLLHTSRPPPSSANFTSRFFVRIIAARGWTRSSRRDLPSSTATTGRLARRRGRGRRRSRSRSRLPRDLSPPPPSALPSRTSAATGLGSLNPLSVWCSSRSCSARA